MREAAESDWPAGTGLLHVYPSDHPHGEVIIVGTDAALTRLRDAIGLALACGQAVPHGILTRDGEGYWCFVVRASAAEMDDLPLHYVGEAYEAEDATMPAWMDARTCVAAAAASPSRTIRPPDARAARPAQPGGRRAPRKPTEPKPGSLIMPLSKPQLGTIRFLATDARVRALSPAATVIYIRLVEVTEGFAANAAWSNGADWPRDAMLARVCGATPEAYASAVEEMKVMGLYADEGEGGFSLVLPE